jgi:hypothetical protein
MTNVDSVDEKDKKDETEIVEKKIIGIDSWYKYFITV